MLGFNPLLTTNLQGCIMSTVAPLSSTAPVSFQTAKRKALQLISAFQNNSISSSSHYPKLLKSKIITEIKDTVNTIDLNNNFNNRIPILFQGKASLCGPAAFFFTLTKIRPDIYVQLVTDLFLNGKAQLKNLKLQSSSKARQQTPTVMNHADWLLFSSINPKYDNPTEEFDGITFPGKLKDWYINAGFTQIKDNTSLFGHETLDTLLQAQNDYSSGYAINFLVNANAFKSFGSKSWGLGIPNHWVVMNSDIKIRLYDEKTKTLAAPVVINQSVIKSIKDKIRAKQLEAVLDRDISTETEDRILLEVFTWGTLHTPVASRIGASQNAFLSYFLSQFYGYIKVKR
jgi:hypothetical protein